MDNSLSARFNRIQTIALGVAIGGAILAFIGAFVNIDRFFQTYLVGYMVWLNMTLGCVGFLIVLYLVNGRWGFATQRVFAAGARIVPLMAILFLPILFRLPQLYPWAAETGVNGSGYDAYHAMPFFIIRMISYFVIWGAAGWYLSSRTYESDDFDAPNPERYRGDQRIAAGFMVLLMVTMTFASFDLVMSVTDGWFSTVFGWLTLTQAGMLAMCFALITVFVMPKEGKLGEVFNLQTQFDISTLMLVMLMAWTYLTVIQYFIMWAGNQPSKVKFYDPRTTGSWESWVFFLTLLHAIPLLLLLTPTLKRNQPFMIFLGGWLIVARVAEMIWLIIPAYSKDSAIISLWDVGMPIALGGVWVAAFIYFYKQRPFVPANHPHLEEALHHGHPEHLEGASTT
ncbi:MAG: hypothetical protein AAF125_04020 [Chloroflexota bacterium]